MRDSLELVEKRCNRADIFAVRNDFALVLDARVGAHLSLEIGAVHFLALRAVANADAQEFQTAHHVCAAHNEWE